MHSSVTRLAAALFAALAASLCAACYPEGQAPRSCAGGGGNCISISVLVDVSATWNKGATNRQENSRLLSAVSSAINNTARDLSPITVRYLAIGERSRERPAACAVDQFTPMLIAGQCQRERDPNKVCNAEQFQNYLSDCNEVMLNGGEQNTEITGAIINALDSMKMSRGAYNVMIILSDFEEDPAPGTPPYDLNELDLTGFDIILIYRVLPQAGQTTDGVQARVRDWRTRLEARGARVDDYLDNGLTATGLTDLLRWGVGRVPGA